MERIAQWLDDLDDWVGVAGLLAERFRNGILKLVSTGLLIAVLVLGVFVATLHPPMAMATAMLLAIGLLNKSVLALS
ncbi:MAG: hypothetical protein AAF351_03110 [Pseudomonadota bacterium]